MGVMGLASSLADRTDPCTCRYLATGRQMVNQHGHSSSRHSSLSWASSLPLLTWWPPSYPCELEARARQRGGLGKGSVHPQHPSARGPSTCL